MTRIDSHAARLLREFHLPAGELSADVLENVARRRTGGAARAEILAEIRAIQLHVASLPVLDSRTPDEILEYDDHGLGA